jgi:parallel beta-helix repeat protein
MATHRARTSRLLLGVGAAVVASTLSAGPASAADVQCGDVLTSDTKLRHDLRCGPGDGLVIGADGVTLDFAGHSLTGPGAYGAGAGGGVRAARVFDFVIRNGTITGYAEGIVLDEARNGHVWAMVLKDNDRGINLAGGGGHLIEKNTVADNGRDAIRLGLSHGNVVTKNEVSGNVFGIGVADGSSGNIISKNTVAETTFDGIWTTGDSPGTEITKNVSTFNGEDGIDVDAVPTTVSKNTADGNGDLGIEAVPGVTDGGGNKANGNSNPVQCTGVSCTPSPPGS